MVRFYFHFSSSYMILGSCGIIYLFIISYSIETNRTLCFQPVTTGYSKNLFGDRLKEDEVIFKLIWN